MRNLFHRLVSQWNGSEGTQRRGAAIAFAVLLLVGACSDPHTAEPMEVVLRNVPTQIEPSVVLVLPGDQADQDRSVSLDLLEVDVSDLVGVENTHDVLGVFRINSVEPQPPSEPSYLGQIGPRGLHGYGASTSSGVETILASRLLSEHQLESAYQDLTISGTVQGSRRIVGLESSPVPGIGSLQIPRNREGFVISYVSATSDPFQRSVAIGRFAASLDDLQAIRWWLGELEVATSDGAGLSFSTQLAAYQSDQGAEGPAATYDVWLESGRITIVRSVGVELDRSSGRPVLEVPSAEVWNRLQALRPSK